jgi:hypothetical protein
MSKILMQLGLALASLQSGFATTLTFSPPGGTFADRSVLPPACGDRVTASSDAVCQYVLGPEGATPNVLVDYGQAPSLSSWSSQPYILTWASGYAALSRVVYGDQFRTNLGFRFDADPGFQVSILDFQIASYLSTPRDVTWQVFDGGFNSLWSSGNVTAPISGFLTLSPAVSASTLYLISSSGDFFFTGIDNVRFSQSADSQGGGQVPEPSTCCLALAGLALGAFRLRRN